MHVWSQTDCHLGTTKKTHLTAFKTYSISSYGCGWKRDVINQGFEFASVTELVVHRKCVHLVNVQQLHTVKTNEHTKRQDQTQKVEKVLSTASWLPTERSVDLISFLSSFVCILYVCSLLEKGVYSENACILCITRLK